MSVQRRCGATKQRRNGKKNVVTLSRIGTLLKQQKNRMKKTNVFLTDGSVSVMDGYSHQMNGMKKKK